MQRQQGKEKEPQEKAVLWGMLVYPVGVIHLLSTATTRAVVRNKPRTAARSLCLPSSKAGIFIPVWRCHRNYHILYSRPVKKQGGMYTQDNHSLHRQLSFLHPFPSSCSWEPGAIGILCWQMGPRPSPEELGPADLTQRHDNRTQSGQVTVTVKQFPWALLPCLL